MGCLSVVFNIIWILTGGWLTALAFFLAGVLCYITIIGIPLGRQAFKMAHLTLAPFGKRSRMAAAPPRSSPTSSGWCSSGSGRQSATS